MMLEGFQMFLTDNLFYILLLTFIIICALFVIKIRDIGFHFREIKKYTWIILILILILGSQLRFNSQECSDQSGLCWSYVEESRSILEKQKLYDFWHPRGYSLLLALGFFTFGLSFYTILYLNLAMGSIMILLVFLLAYVLFKREEIALIAAVIYSLFPVSIYFAKINASEISSMFFVTLTFLIYIISLKENKRLLYLLSLLLLVFSIHIRLDNSMFIPIFFIGYFIERKKISFEKLKLPFIIFIIFMVPLSFYYVNGNELFGPCGDSEICKDYPHIFSASYFVPTLQRHLSYLTTPDYPLVLYVFLLLPLLFIRREKNLIIPFLWIAAFFLFYCLYWGSFFTGLDLYQILLHPPFAILMGYGIYRTKNVLEEKVIPFKIPPMIKFVNTIIVIILVIMLFHFTTNVFETKERQNCLIDNLFNLTYGFSSDECILFENSQSWYHTPKPMRVMDVLFPDKHLALSLEECENRSEVYYIHTNNTACGPSFFGDEKTLFEDLNSNFKINEVRKKGCATLYRVEEPV